eukprot:CAMPEP_0198221664 /NCGR_PEP_ID=MMETSP1445-20131203/84654_1 /TAXON_ID=36898 /ORGANISM="Pyramimonas sp., Strain CCMP2087" /LENGTH=104 /DNA_ID=CAMNT_0043899887 /DNA_START=173 /DNA_END=487 /DNA_ORIENTATION=+
MNRGASFCLGTHSARSVYGPEVAHDFDGTKLQLWGSVLLLLAIVGIVLGTYALVVSKISHPTEVWVLDELQKDMFYCLLVPMTIPVTLIAVYANWVSLKFFKHA